MHQEPLCVFRALNLLHHVQQASEAATEVVLMLYRHEIRRLLPLFWGYECSVRPALIVALAIALSGQPEKCAWSFDLKLE